MTDQFLRKNQSKNCKGCQSNGSYCSSYAPAQRKIFRDMFCPCKTCLVKVTCSDPKISIYLPMTGRRPPDKCKVFRKAVNDCHDYLGHKKIRTTTIKRRKRK